MKDLLIIGAGPAGLTAAIYAVRAGIECAILEKFSPGGQVVNTYEVENYPGFENPIPGWELMSAMEAQARRLGVPIESVDVAGIRKDDAADSFIVTTADGGEHAARAVILATGASFKKVGVPGEVEFTGRGVSYCATCDGAFYKGRIVAVIGGGNTALEEAIFLTRFATRVYLIHRRDEFRGAKILQDRVLSNDRITPVYDTVVGSINGATSVESVTLINKKTNVQSEQHVDGVFVFVGYEPNTAYCPAELLNPAGEVIVNRDMKTRIDGLFAAGDLREGSIRQIVAACGDAAVAAVHAYAYLAEREHR